MSDIGLPSANAGGNQIALLEEGQNLTPYFIESVSVSGIFRDTIADEIGREVTLDCATSVGKFILTEI
nr:hypothetical protein [uncultured Rhodopila sp.]